MTRTAFVALGGGVLLLVWVAASGAPSPPPEPQRDTPRAAQTPAPVIDLDREAALLHARLANPPAYPPLQRDPFSFGAAKPAPARARAIVAPAPAVIEAPPEPVSDAPRLVAVLTDAADGGPIRRAVLAVGDDVQIAKPGETVLHYRVRSIGADVIELVDIATGVVTRVILR